MRKANLQVAKGDTYKRLTVIEELEPRQYKHGTKRMVSCECECGNTVEVFLGNLRRGTTRSCGCYDIEQFIARNNAGLMCA